MNLGIDTPTEYGGIGADFKYCLVAEEEQAYAGPDFFGPGFGLHTNIVMPYLFNYGTEEQKQRYLPEMTTGETISCIGMTEPSAGSDLQVNWFEVLRILTSIGYKNRSPT